MNIKFTLLSALFSAMLVTGALAQSEKSQHLSLTLKDSTEDKKDTSVGKLAVTHHQLNVAGKSISYTAKTGYMAMRDKDDKVIAKMFYVATQQTTQAARLKDLLPLFLTVAPARPLYGCTWVLSGLYVLNSVTIKGMRLLLHTNTRKTLIPGLGLPTSYLSILFQPATAAL